MLRLRVVPIVACARPAGAPGGMLIFDCDGVLVDGETIYLDAAVAAALEAGSTAVPGAHDALAAADFRCVESSTAMPRLR